VLAAHTPALRRLFGPGLDAFVAAWGRDALLASATLRDAGDFGDLFGPDAVDELIARRGLRTPFLRVARDGSTLPESAFTFGGGVGAGVTDQVSDDKVRRLLDGGATVVLQGLQRTWTPIADFSQSLAEELGHPVQVNAYVTPAASQGFAAHYDVHDVFVVQVHGTKRWVVHPPVLTNPLRSQTWDARAGQVEAVASRTPLMEADLAPGDVLYLPRGFVHSARALGGLTIHLTIGIHAWTQHHLAEAYLDAVRLALAEDEGIRGALALGVDVRDPGQLRLDAAAAREAVETAVAGVRLADIAAALAGQARGSQRAASLGPIAALASADAVGVGASGLDAPGVGALGGVAPGADAVLRLRPYVLASLSDAPDGHLIVKSRAGRLTLDGELRPLVERLIAGEPVLASELGDAARTLLIEGLAVAD
jgi:bifunctional lysine-specific demethylase and histidyl-hydroxylase NO66